MKMRDLRQKARDELEDALRERRVRLDELRFLVRQKKIKNVREIAGAKKDIARILTLASSQASSQRINA